MFEKIINFSIQNKLVIGIMTLLLIVWGAVSLGQLPFDSTPDITNNQVQVITQAPTLGAEEVEQYGDIASRRLLVKPGITGLWQVSGRSDLSWEESVRLDLYYVENWSLTGDLIILLRTVRAVFAKEGAY